MKRCTSIVAVLLAASPLVARVAYAQTDRGAGAPGLNKDQIVSEATKPLPDDLKADATVVSYDAKTGARNIVRQGTNFIECQPKAADGFVRCYNKTLAPRRDMEAMLRAKGMKDEDVTKEIQAATKDGRLKPPPFGTVSYRYSDDPGRIKLLWVISVPNATPEMLGVSTASQRDAALKGSGKPWMMLPGTPGAHIMIPINPGPNSGTK